MGDTMRYKLGLIISVIILLLVVFNLPSKEEQELKTDTLIAYIDGRRTDTIPTKSNDITVDRIVCDNNADAEWDNTNWGIFINSITNNSTKCSVYFKTFPAPELYQGLIPVTYDASGNTVVADTTTDWYDYDNHIWANAVLGTSSARSKTAGQTLSDSEILQYYVWIPRYRYQLFNVNADSSITAQMINIEFENKNKVKSNGSSNGQWLTHPAFTFGNTELNGIWVGKFEITGSLPDSTNQTNMTILPNQTSLKSTSLSAFFSASRSIDTTYYSNYGTNTNEIDTHIMKNIEWGATAYLTNSKYGRYETSSTCVAGGCEVWVNPSSTYTTGCAGAAVTTAPTTTCNTWNTTLGVHASTTDNQYGIYDMSGCSYDLVMANVSSDSTTYVFNSKSSGFSTQPLDRYIDKYLTLVDDYKLGDATLETKGWFADNMDGTSTWFGRGQRALNSTAPGVFAYIPSVAGSSSLDGSRMVLTAQDGYYNGNGLN